MFKKKFKALSFLLALFTILIFTSRTGAQFNLYLSPLLVERDLAPGVTKSFKLNLRNEDTKNAVRLLAYPSDMRESPRGAYEVVERGTSKFSCADWMELSDTNFVIEPGGMKEIKVKIKAPRDAFGGRYAAVVFEIVPEEGPAGKAFGSVKIHYKLPAFVEITIKRFGGLQRKAVIEDFTVETDPSGKLEEKLGKGPLRFVASVKNEGNIHVIGKGTLFIKNKEGRTKRRVPLGGGRGVVLPEATVDFRSFLRKPPPGEYIAKAVINCGGLSPMVAEVPFTVSRTRSSALGSFKASSYIALDIKPEHFEMKIPPRGFRAVTFSFRNDERETIEVKASLKDIEYDEKGDLVLLDSSETGRSCREWISIEPQELNIAPEKRGRVKLTLQAPPEGEGGYYACVVFDALLKGSKEDVISTPFQIPVIISVPPHLEKKVEVVDLNISASAGKPALFYAYLKNTGNVHLKPKGKISLQVLKQVKFSDDIIYLGEPKYERVGELTFEEVEQYVLPGGIRKMQAGYPGALETGKYSAEVTIYYGGADPATFKKEFRVK